MEPAMPLPLGQQKHQNGLTGTFQDLLLSSLIKWL